jgi:hypothetical protein
VVSLGGERFSYVLASIDDHALDVAQLEPEHLSELLRQVVEGLVGHVVAGHQVEVADHGQPHRRGRPDAAPLANSVGLDYGEREAHQNEGHQVEGELADLDEEHFRDGFGPIHQRTTFRYGVETSSAPSDSSNLVLYG